MYFPSALSEGSTPLDHEKAPFDYLRLKKHCICGCNSLKEIIILSEKIKISNASFSECDSLVSFCAENLVEIPESCFKKWINRIAMFVDISTESISIYIIRKFL